METGEYMYVVEGAVCPVQVTSTRFHDSPNVTEQFWPTISGQDRLSVFCGKNDVIAHLVVS